jgi:hypothetical protein
VPEEAGPAGGRLSGRAVAAKWRSLPGTGIETGSRVRPHFRISLRVFSQAIWPILAERLAGPAEIASSERRHDLPVASAAPQTLAFAHERDL